ncbi:MAG: hypothetical protein K8I65_13700 [Thermoanaerobaculia bacterium]|nr:hypothetical protein [Thermoanaerobaculia bacterium]
MGARSSVRKRYPFGEHSAESLFEAFARNPDGPEWLALQAAIRRWSAQFELAAATQRRGRPLEVPLVDAGDPLELIAFRYVLAEALRQGFSVASAPVPVR